MLLASALGGKDLLREAAQAFGVAGDGIHQLPVALVQRMLGEFLDRGVDHRQGRSELVGDVGHEVDVLLLHLLALLGDGQQAALLAQAQQEPDAEPEDAQAGQDVEEPGPPAGPGGGTDDDGQAEFVLTPVSVRLAHAGAEYIMSGGHLGIRSLDVAVAGLPVPLEPFEPVGVVEQRSGFVVHAGESEGQGVLPPGKA